MSKLRKIVPFRTKPVEQGIEAYEKQYQETMVINLQKQAAKLGFEVTRIEPLPQVC